VGGERIGLFGGTFNPIHQGHLRGAEEIREIFGLREVIFIPSAVPPHKGMRGVIDVRHRFEMVRLATRTNPHFRASDVEVNRPGKSYSIDTLRHFLEEYPAGSLFFILGRDAFMEVETWKDFRDLFSLASFVVMARPGFHETPSGVRLPEALLPLFRYDQEGKAWIHRSGCALHFEEITFLDISSTKVRELIEKERSVKYLIPAEVEAYVKEHGLYREKG
jgi:nicotinate-nucleotide adenylyltransferase